MNSALKEKIIWCPTELQDKDKGNVLHEHNRAESAAKA